MKKINLKSVDKTTWIRTAVLLIALINQALVIFGVTDKEADIDLLTHYASYFLTAVSAVWAWWKNNSFTDVAQKADSLLSSEENAKG